MMKIISQDHNTAVALTSLIILAFLNLITFRQIKKLDDKVTEMHEQWKKDRQSDNHKL
ncbi:hypothetical protein [Jeotgalicoccus coquinae]|uniref:Uncharacterized protein n=1 Tax=Jeotgalicoccus coquinae TaxID=709509 RepID=A0A6V7RN12_9STAP|nr:hypothetical protein [Jeotgalicoccus coquinae]MBB6422285.1 hypothetical protein [Jeotgalicoccus coquinae]CAD2079082.1 hypothetical protein JEOCOQ751_01375 [Jeotgalicoccus coquinae]